MDELQDIRRSLKETLVFRKDRHIVEVFPTKYLSCYFLPMRQIKTVNDSDLAIVNFFRVLRSDDQFKEFSECVLNNKTPEDILVKDALEFYSVGAFLVQEYIDDIFTSIFNIEESQLFQEIFNDCLKIPMLRKIITALRTTQIEFEKDTHKIINRFNSEKTVFVFNLIDNRFLVKQTEEIVNNYDIDYVVFHKEKNIKINGEETNIGNIRAIKKIKESAFQITLF